jgi:hypothetical protein
LILGCAYCGAMLIAGLLADNSLGQTAADKQEALEFLFSGMQEGRGALKSGVCRMQGRYIAKDDRRAKPVFDGAWNVFLAFEGKKLCFDITKPGWIVDEAEARSPRHAIAPRKKGITRSCYCRNGEKSASWYDGGPMIELAADTGQPPRGGWGYFDVKALGFYDEVSLGRGTDLVKLITMWRSDKNLSEIDRSDPKIWRVTWTDHETQITTDFRLWVDVESGFTPVRFENRERIGDGPWGAIVQSQTEWRNVQGVYVPVRHEYHFAPPRSKPSTDLQCDLTWEKVNEPIDPITFTYESFDAPTHIGVVDTSSGHPITLKAFQPPPRQEQHDWTRSLVWALGATYYVLLIGIFLAWYYRRRRQALLHRARSRGDSAEPGL